MTEVYINTVAKFLPNEAVTNDRIEQVLGVINEKPSRAKSIVLRNNKIISRHYAITKDGSVSHNNAQLTHEAIKQVFRQSAVEENDVSLLSCGTSTPDQLLPSHASMVHGLWQHRPMELNSASGVCSAGMNALKYAYMAIASGSARKAISTGSERVSSWLRAEKFNPESEKLTALNQNPIIAFEKDFLRWMLSDGAGAMLLSDQPNDSGISLKIHWIEGFSFANELDTCMYAGAIKENGKLMSWSDVHPDEWLEKSIFSIKQDIKLLEANIIKKGIESTLETLRKKQVAIEEIDYYLPHISSFFFKNRLYDALAEAGIEIPPHKWFINLEKVGNVGSAAIYMQLEELFLSDRLKPGEKILLSVPESGRFSYVYALLEVT